MVVNGLSACGLLGCIVVEEDVLEPLVEERQHEQQQAQHNEGDDLAYGRHTPQVVQHKFGQYQPEGEQADDAQILVMQPHAHEHLGKSCHRQR